MGRSSNRIRVKIHPRTFVATTGSAATHYTQTAKRAGRQGVPLHPGPIQSIQVAKSRGRYFGARSFSRFKPSKICARRFSCWPLVEGSPLRPPRRCLISVRALGLLARGSKGGIVKLRWLIFVFLMSCLRLLPRDRLSIRILELFRWMGTLPHSSDPEQCFRELWRRTQASMPDSASQ